MVIVKPFLISVLYLLFVPIIHGVSNLQSLYVAEVLEKFVSFIGIIIFIPLSSLELDNRIKEVVFVKSFSYTKTMFLRIITAFFVLCGLIFVFAFLLLSLKCEFSFLRYVAGTIITGLSLGSIGLVTSLISHNLILGYAVSIGFFMLNWIGIIDDNNLIYLFSMTNNEYYQKKIFIVVNCILILSVFAWLKYNSNDINKL